jgi:hypothetical protein
VVGDVVVNLDGDGDVNLDVHRCTTSLARMCRFFDDAVCRQSGASTSRSPSTSTTPTTTTSRSTLALSFEGE